jgi:hypothetical protein
VTSLLLTTSMNDGRRVSTGIWCLCKISSAIGMGMGQESIAATCNRLNRRSWHLGNGPRFRGNFRSSVFFVYSSICSISRASAPRVVFHSPLHRSETQ